MARNVIDLILNIKRKGEGAKQAKGELGEVEKAAKMAGAAMASYLTVESLKATYEFAKLGAQSIRTRNAFVAISGGADEAAARLGAMQTATRGALSEQRAMAAANQLMQMGLASNADELGRVTEMAVRLGTAMGRDASQSIEEFALLLANQSIPRLDTFGISAGRVRQRIQELQKATPGLTREMAFMQATFEEGEKAMSRLGDAADDEMLAFERLEATTENLKLALAERLAPALATAASAMELLVMWDERLADATVTHRGEVMATAETYEEYAAELQRAAEAAGLTTDAQGNLVRVIQQGDISMGIEATHALVEENYLLSEAMWDVRNVVRPTAADMDTLADKMMMIEAPTAAAADGMEGLATSASKVAGAFGEMTFDNESLWNLALASGASVEALGGLAQHLGIATDAEIQNTMAAYGLVEAFGAGTISVEDLEQGFDDLAMAQIHTKIEAANLEAAVRGVTQGIEGVTSVDEAAAVAARELAMAEEEAAIAAEQHRTTVGDLVGGVMEMEESMAAATYGTYDLMDGLDQMAAAEVAAEREAARLELAMEAGAEKAEEQRLAMLGLNAGLLGTKSALSGAEDAARRMQSALSRIEREIKIRVVYEEHGQRPGGGGAQQYQHGTGFHSGGLALVGEMGPELAMLPRGTQVLPAWRTRDVMRQSVDQRQDHRQYSETIVVQDTLAAAMVMEERRRVRDRRIESGF